MTGGTEGQGGGGLGHKMAQGERERQSDIKNQEGERERSAEGRR